MTNSESSHGSSDTVEQRRAAADPEDKPTDGPWVLRCGWNYEYYYSLLRHKAAQNKYKAQNVQM